MSKQDDLFNRTVFDQFDADWDDIRDNPIPWKNIFNLNASTAFELCAAAIDRKNHLFSLQRQNRSSVSKTKSRQVSNGCFAPVNLLKLIKRESIACQKLGLRDQVNY